MTGKKSVGDVEAGRSAAKLPAAADLTFTAVEKAYIDTLVESYDAVVKGNVFDLIIIYGAQAVVICLSKLATLQKNDPLYHQYHETMLNVNLGLHSATFLRDNYPEDNPTEALGVFELNVYNHLIHFNDLFKLSDDRLRILERTLEPFASTLSTLRGRMRDDLDTAVKKAKAEAVQKAKPQLSAVRLLAAYEVLVRHSDLTNPALLEDDRLRRAQRLLTTYDRLRKRDPEFHDSNDQLKAARRIQKAAYRQRQRAKRAEAPASRGRLARLHI